MAQLVTRPSIRELVRQQGNMRGQEAYRDTILDTLINQALKDLWAELVTGYDEWGVAPATLMTTAGVRTVTLPADFLELRRVRRKADSGQDFADCEATTLLADPYPEGGGAELRKEPRRPGAYYVSQPVMTAGPVLVLVPTPREVESILIWYARTAPQYTDDVTSFDFGLGFEDLVVQATIARARQDPQGKQMAKQLAMEYIARIKTRKDRRTGGPDYFANYQRNSPYVRNPWRF